MKKRIRNVTIGLLMAAISVASVQAEDNLLYDAQHTLAQFQSTDTSFANFLAGSAGYAVFPSVGKGGFIIGGARGKGIVFQNGKVIGEATLSQASIGAQAGGQSYDEIIVFQNQEALNHFKSGDFSLRGDLSAVAAHEGASKSANFENGVAVFTMPKKGLMAQAAVGGQRFKFTPAAQAQ